MLCKGMAREYLGGGISEFVNKGGINYACFIHFEISQKMKADTKKLNLLLFLRALLNFQQIFTCNIAMESYWHVDYTGFVHFQISPKMKAVEAKEGNEKSFFGSRAFIF